MASFKDKTVIVTGGARGIGRAIAEYFLANAARVYICARSAPDAPIAADDNIAQFIAADIRKSDEAANVITQCEQETGRLDVLINNAGGGPPGLAIETAPAYIEKIISLNLTAPFILSQEAAKIMRRQKEGGSIINIASISAVRPSPESAAYGAAKAGLVNLTQSLAQEWAPLIRVNALILGLVATEAALSHYGGNEGVKRIESTLPMKRMANPKEIAAACAFLASREASYITGASLEVHGGGERPSFLEAAKAALQR